MPGRCPSALRPRVSCAVSSRCSSSRRERLEKPFYARMVQELVGWWAEVVGRGSSSKPHGRQVGNSVISAAAAPWPENEGLCSKEHTTAVPKIARTPMGEMSPGPKKFGPHLRRNDSSMLRRKRGVLGPPQQVRRKLAPARGKSLRLRDECLRGVPLWARAQAAASAGLFPGETDRQPRLRKRERHHLAGGGMQGEETRSRRQGPKKGRPKAARMSTERSGATAFASISWPLRQSGRGALLEYGRPAP